MLSLVDIVLLVDKVRLLEMVQLLDNVPLVDMVPHTIPYLLMYLLTILFLLAVLYLKSVIVSATQPHGTPVQLSVVFLDRPFGLFSSPQYGVAFWIHQTQACGHVHLHCIPLHQTAVLLGKRCPIMHGKVTKIK